MIEETAEYKKEFVQNMMQHAWSGYETYAFGHNELKPIAKTGHAPPILGRASQVSSYWVSTTIKSIKRNLIQK